MSFDYHRWRDLAPIECVVNVALLYLGERRIVQLDVTYYDEPSDRERIERLVSGVTRECIERRDSSGNIILYLRCNAAAIEDAIEKSGGFLGKRFASLLDASFYVCSANLSTSFERKRLRRVSIDVIHNGRSGALMVQMLYPAIARKHMNRMYARFEQLSKRVEALDPNLHTALTVYTKPGMWRAGPEYVARDLTTLS